LLHLFTAAYGTKRTSIGRLPMSAIRVEQTWLESPGMSDIGRIEIPQRGEPLTELLAGQLTADYAAGAN